MSMDGRYIAKSHGRRCEYVHGWTVYRKEPWKAVRICPWLYGISQRAMEGGANMSMDVRYTVGAWMHRNGECTGCTGRYLLLGNCSCVALISYIRVTMQYLHFHHPWWSTEICSMHFSHFRHPWWSYVAVPCDPHGCGKVGQRRSSCRDGSETITHLIC